jgi:hypothetical protein
LVHGGVPVAADGGQVEAAMDGREVAHDLVEDVRAGSSDQRFEFRPEKSNFVRISPISVGSGK